MSYRFRPDQVRAIEAVRAVPILGKGIRIHHDITGYPQLVIFWTMGNPEALASHLREYGYGTDPDAKYDKTDFPAERLTCLMMAIMLVLFLLLPGLSILSWLVLFVFSGR